MLLAVLLAAQSSSWLTPLRDSLDLPAIGGLEIEGSKVVGLVAEGVREVGSEEKISKDAVWHLGSNSKAITAALVATYIKSGAIGFDSKVLPLLKIKEDEVATGWGELTVRQLIEHNGGLSAVTYPAGRMWFQDKRPVREQRADYARKVLAKPPGPKRYLYSNQNYTILGAVCEMLGEDTWENLVRSRVLKPIGIESAGFGPVSLRNPQPHMFKDGKFRVLDQDEAPDNAPVIYPAGGLHMNLNDYSKWLIAVMKKDTTLLPPSVWTDLLTPSTVGGRYAGGWLVVRSNGETKFLTHFGSNTLNTLGAWVDPLRSKAVCIATNCHSDVVMKKINEAMVDWMRR
ncbi:MAG: serine hydrolase [Fimbriimonadaceae bacterium]